MKKFAILIIMVWCVAVRADMINRYSFNDGDTAAVDSIGGKDGTLTNTATISGNKLVLDGSSAANLPSDVLGMGLTSVTIEAWFQDNSTADNWCRLFDFGETNGGDGGQGLFCVPRQYGTTRFTVATNGTPSWSTGENTVSGPIHPGLETHVACVWDGPAKEIKIYINGHLEGTIATTMNLAAAARENAFLGDSSYPGDPYFNGSINEFRIYDTALTDEEVTESFNGGPDISLSSDMQAKKPMPKNSAKEVSIDVGEISWTPGENVIAQNGTHNVFFGTDKDSVTNATVANPLGVMVSSDLALDNNSVALDRLEYNTTYYWRVDEVNNPASTGTAKGKVWSFKTELKGYPILPASIVNVTSLGGVYPDEPDRQDPNSTCTGAGLDANDMHGTNMKTMWLGMDEGAYLQYEFDKAYKLYDMLVWNYNEEAPNNEYFGAKDVKVEFSLDGENWTEVTDVPEFTMATGDNQCIANTDVLFNGAAAKYVKLIFLTGWGDLGLYGISEVRFSAEPTRAQNPAPLDKAKDIKVNPELSWKPGRYSVNHNVYISTDENAVAEGTAAVMVSDVNNVTPALEIAKTYFWRVDEVNNAEAYSIWDGSVWSFDTAKSVIVDNFEVDYGNKEVNFVWAIWKDGIEVSANGGSEIGVGIDPPGLAVVNHSGEGHSIAVNYNNSGANSYSQITAQAEKLPIATTNWSLGSPKSLVIWLLGDVNNPVTDKLYVKINNNRKNFDDVASYINRPTWTKMELPLDGINISNVSSITIGVEKTGATGGSGILYFDDIQLTVASPEPSNPGTEGLVAYYAMENNVKDGSTSGINGTIKGAPTYVPGPFTAYGKALSFKADTNDVVDLGKADPFNFAGSFTFAFWADIQNWSTEWNYVMVATRGEGMGFSIRRGGAWVAGMQNKSGTGLSFTTRGISLDGIGTSEDMIVDQPVLNSWTHITCVFDQENKVKSVYYDGELVQASATAANAKLTASTTNASIGARANSANTGFENYFIGMLDEIKIYNKALKAEEVKFLADPTP
jgi:hypothetical protein